MIHSHSGREHRPLSPGKNLIRGLAVLGAALALTLLAACGGGEPEETKPVQIVLPGLVTPDQQTWDPEAAATLPALSPREEGASVFSPGQGTVPDGTLPGATDAPSQRPGEFPPAQGEFPGGPEEDVSGDSEGGPLGPEEGAAGSGSPGGSQWDGLPQPYEPGAQQPSQAGGAESQPTPQIGGSAGAGDSGYVGGVPGHDNVYGEGTPGSANLPEAVSPPNVTQSTSGDDSPESIPPLGVDTQEDLG